MSFALLTTYVRLPNLFLATGSLVKYDFAQYISFDSMAAGLAAWPSPQLSVLRLLARE